MRSFLISALLFAGTSALASQSIYVEPATGSGSSQSDLDTATALVRSSAGDLGSATVDQPDKADLTLRPQLIKLGQAYILVLTKVKNGQEIFSSKLKAERLDELDKVATRLTRSVLLGERAKDAPRVGEITDQEAHDETQRRPERKATYLGFGGSDFKSLNSTGIGYSFGLGYAWDLNVMMINLMADGNVNGGAFFFDGTLGLTYFLDTRDVAPYLSADFGGGAAKLDGGGVFDGQTVGGFVLGVGAGVQILRTAVVNLDLGLRANWLMHDTSQGTPSAYSVRLGVYF